MSSPWKDFPNNKTEQPFEGIPAGQEPEVMPGFTAPAAGPWPPLSREQVVELHEALVSFRTAYNECGGRTGNLGDPLMLQELWALGELLERLNIGTPPQPRRWTNDDIQAALEKREEPTDFLSSSPLGVKPCPLCKGSGQARSVQQINPDGSYEPKDAPLVNCMVCEGTGQISPEDEVQEEVKHNCWTCSRAVRGKIGCDLMANHGWLNMLVASARCGMDLVEKSQKADHCPGWEAKP